MLTKISRNIAPLRQQFAPEARRTREELDAFDSRSAGAALVAPLHQVGAALPPRVQTLFAELTDVMFNHTGRVWPGYDWRSDQIMVVDPRVNEAYVWNVGGAQPGRPPSVTTIPADQLPNEFRSYFNVGEWNGVPTLSVSLAELDRADPTGEKSYHSAMHTLAAHEGFHFFGQTDFEPVPMPFEARFPELPAPAEPRYYRQKVADSLMEALGADDPAMQQKAKAAAAYWNGKFKAEFPAQAAATRGLDIVEGTARYVEFFSAAAGKLGADRPDSELIADLVEHRDQVVGRGNFAQGAEPYDLGVLAGLLLRRDGTFEAMAPRLQAAELTPVEAALDGVAPQVQPEDEATLARAREVVSKRNEANAKVAARFFADMNDPNNARFVLPSEWQSGSTRFGGGMRLMDLPGQPLLYEQMGVELEQPGTGVILRLEDCPAMEGDQLLGEDQPGEDRTEIAVAKSGIKVNADGTVDIDTPTVKVSGLRAKVVEQGGLTRIVLDEEPARLMRPEVRPQGPRLIEQDGRILA